MPDNRRNFLKMIPAGLGAVAIGAGTLDIVPATNAPRHLMLLVLDRSASMSKVRHDVITGVNKVLEEQKNNAGMLISVVQFDSAGIGGFKTNGTLFTETPASYCESIFDFTTAANTPRLTESDYIPRGGTPLLAAFVEAVAQVEKVVRPQDRVLINVQTDGYENSSPAEITKDVVKNLIDSKKALGNWTFAFMGADIDAWSEGGSLGISAGATIGYNNTTSGNTMVYETLARSSNIWYNSTGGGMDVATASAAPANLNESFYVAEDKDSSKKS